jgi:saccharopine dehydrogenase-like NADP-dependent oxidoreductase
MKKALVIGVGPLNGLGGQLCKKISQNNFEVFVAGRTINSLNKVVENITQDGNKAKPIVVDTTDENQIKNMIKEVGSGLDFAIYNVGNNTPGKIIDMSQVTLNKVGKRVALVDFYLLKKSSKYF